MARSNQLVNRKTSSGDVPAPQDLGHELDQIEGSALEELERRITDIDHMYRQAAENMGQLYMYADSVCARELTRRLDEPMRNASRNELLLRELIDELQTRTRRRPRARAQRGRR